MKFKTTPSGYVVPQNPYAPPGETRPNSGLYTYAITGVPATVGMSTVQKLLNETVTFRAENAGRFTFDFQELGSGRILTA